MPNEFIARNGITSLGNVVVTGSLTATGTINMSGSIASASFATTAATASSADNLLVRNTLTAQTLVVQTITSSVDFVTGSTRFGSIAANTHQFTGSVSMTGSLTGIGAAFSDFITSTGNATSSAAFVANNPSGTSGTAQHYINFTAGATTIGRILRGNGASGLEANGLNIDNFSGFQVRLNQLGGSGGTFSVTGGAATFSSSVTATNNVTVSSTTNASVVAATNSTTGYAFIDLINNGESGKKCWNDYF